MQFVLARLILITLIDINALLAYRYYLYLILYFLILARFINILLNLFLIFLLKVITRLLLAIKNVYIIIILSLIILLMMIILIIN